MWRLKKRSLETRRPSQSEPPRLDRLAAPIARLGIRVQKAFAGNMARLTGQLSPKRLKTALVVFSLFCGGASSYLILSAIIGQGGKASLLTPQRVQSPKHVSEDWAHRVLPNPSSDARLIRRIHAFRQYMDSLQKAGGSHYDSILTTRRGLLDSLSQVEEMYQSPLLK